MPQMLFLGSAEPATPPPPMPSKGDTNKFPETVAQEPLLMVWSPQPQHGNDPAEQSVVMLGGLR